MAGRSVRRTGAFAGMTNKQTTEDPLRHTTPLCRNGSDGRSKCDAHSGGGAEPRAGRDSAEGSAAEAERAGGGIPAEVKLNTFLAEGSVDVLLQGLGGMGRRGPRMSGRQRRGGRGRRGEQGRGHHDRTVGARRGSPGHIGSGKGSCPAERTRSSSATPCTTHRSATGSHWSARRVSPAFTASAAARNRGRLHQWPGSWYVTRTDRSCRTPGRPRPARPAGPGGAAPRGAAPPAGGPRRAGRASPRRP